MNILFENITINIKTVTCYADQTGKNEDLIQDQTFV